MTFDLIAVSETASLLTRFAIEFLPGSKWKKVGFWLYSEELGEWGNKKERRLKKGISSFSLECAAPATNRRVSGQ